MKGDWFYCLSLWLSFVASIIWQYFLLNFSFWRSLNLSSGNILSLDQYTFSIPFSFIKSFYKTLLYKYWLWMNPLNFSYFYFYCPFNYTLLPVYLSFSVSNRFSYIWSYSMSSLSFPFISRYYSQLTLCFGSIPSMIYVILLFSFCFLVTITLPFYFSISDFSIWSILL